MYKSVDAFMKNVISRSPGENEFHQAVHEVISSKICRVKLSGSIPPMLISKCLNSGCLRRSKLNCLHLANSGLSRA